jgi:hypothetical protein
MLESFVFAFEKRLLVGDNTCPFQRKTIETYLQILKPAYDFTMVSQFRNSTIGDVVPCLMMALSKTG